MILRDEVKWFAQQMEAQLKANDHKGGWRDCPIEWLLPRIHDEYRELVNAIADKSVHQVPDDIQAIVNECADIANFAMMVADVVHHYGVQASAPAFMTVEASAASVIDTRFCKSHTSSR